jgi:alkylation response protein AidB-like acyl-CoA dehydrogenase
MMDFDVSEEMSVRLAMIGEFMDREVIPLERELLHGDRDTLDDAVAAAQRKVKQMGLWAPNHPVEVGGLGLSMVDHGLFAEAVGRSPLGMNVFGTQAPDAGNVEILHKYGTEYLLPHSLVRDLSRSGGALGVGGDRAWECRRVL